jgi:hypothetical protein
VSVVHIRRNAHAALSTVAKVGASSHSAETALFTMEGMFVQCHPNVAFWAMIFCKGYSTFVAFIGTVHEYRKRCEKRDEVDERSDTDSDTIHRVVNSRAGLTSVALLANNLLDTKSIHRPTC